MCCLHARIDASEDGAYGSMYAPDAGAFGATMSSPPADATADPAVIESRLSRRDLIHGTLLTAGGILGGLLSGRALAQTPPPPVVHQCTAAVPVVGTGGVPGAHCFTSPVAGDRILLLGVSGGPLPNPFASLCAQALVINGKPYVIDFGTGVMRELILSGIPQPSLGTIRTAFLTHHHVDHSFDYPALLIESWFINHFFGAGDFEMDVFGPHQMHKFTNDVLEMYKTDIENRASVLNVSEPKHYVHTHEFNFRRNGVVMRNDDVEVSATRVTHGPLDAFAFRFDIVATGKSVVFSGDTAFSTNLIDLAHGADFLVHEAMHIPALLQSAPPQRADVISHHFPTIHTPAADVGVVAREAGVRTLVLDHLLPVFVPENVWVSEVRKNYDGNLIVGRDRMQISLSA
jgi:ribonuclease BN (tRNA processing enzyme)